MHTGKRTKIIATIGPASDSHDIIEGMIKGGVNVFRFNMKHNTNEWHVDRIKRVQDIADKLNVSVGILIDLQGPEVRIETRDEKSITLKKNDSVIFTHDFESATGGSTEVSLNSEYPLIKIPPKIIVDSLEIKDHFSIDDGSMEFKVQQTIENGFVAISLDDGVVMNKKTLNLIEKDINLPSLIKSDMDKLDIGAEAKVDFVALSYVRTKEDLVTLKTEMNKRGLKARVVAKIESEKGISNIDEIIDESDAIMVARGDLGIEMPIERIAYLQKETIKKCRAKNKQVIVATQMLQTMTDKPRPTRAEATDVSNAVYDGADAVMLSAESATGKYPVKTVEIMNKILKFNESHAKVETLETENKDQTNTIVRAAISITENNWIDVDKVIIFTETGYTANVISSYRISTPVIAVSEDENSVEGLALSYGILPYHVQFPHGDFNFTNVRDHLQEMGLVQNGDKVLVIHGKQWKDPGKTNAMFLLEV